MKNNTKLSEIYDIAIVGAGPSGLTAAIYSQRGQAKTIIIDGSAPGGKMVTTSDIENYPGFKNILGPDLSVKMFEQVSDLKIPLLGGFVQNIKQDQQQHVFKIYLDNGDIIRSYAVIVATGTKERLIGAPGEKEFYGKGVSNCAVCDGAFFKGQIIMVVGGGYAAIEEGIYLTKFAKQVIIVHRRQGFRADKNLVAQARANPKIKFILDHVLVKITGQQSVEAATIESVNTKAQTTIAVKAVFPFIGSDPVSGFLKSLPILDAAGYVKVNRHCETQVAGLFGAGDVTDTVLRQIVTATSDGAIAAQQAIFYLDQLKSKFKSV